MAKKPPTSKTLALEGKRLSGELKLSEWQLVVAKGADRDKTIKLGRQKIRIGSSPDCELRLADQSVSRLHCEILREDERFVLRDLNSTNGTYLNGTRIKEGYLAAESMIQVGTTVLRVNHAKQSIPVVPSSQENFGEVIGKSIQMREIFGVLEKVSNTELPILIEGETGTGKEVLARSIHDHSHRGKGNFVVVDCGSVAENLVESEIFGHLKGAYTGAVNDRKGAFELAHGGTVFLDEIGELSLELQPKLLRVLERGEVKPLGAGSFQQTDVRIIAATNRGLAQLVAAGQFREDLYYRLAVIPIVLPPLSERHDDLQALVEHFIASGRTKTRSNVRAISKEALSVLRNHDWPGNIRELKNAIEGAMSLAAKDVLQPPDFLFFHRIGEGRAVKNLALIGKSLTHIEKTVILQTIEAHGGNRTAAAKTLGIAYSTLYEKLKKYDAEDAADS